MHHKDHAIGGNRGVGPQQPARCLGNDGEWRHQIRTARCKHNDGRDNQVHNQARFVGADYFAVIGRPTRCDKRNVNGMQARRQGKDNVKCDDLGKDKWDLHRHPPARGIKTIMRNWPGSPSRRYATLRPCSALSSSRAAGVCDKSSSSLENSVARSSTLHESWSLR